MLMDSFTAITKALCDSHRVRALMALRNGELCACRIIELLGLAPSTVSKHMSVLKHAGLVDSRKEGRWNYFRLPDSGQPAAIEWIINSVADSPTILGDNKRLKQIMRLDADEICKKQRNTGDSGK